MSTIAHIFGLGFSIAAFLVMGGVIPPMPKFLADATPFFVVALLAEAAYPREKMLDKSPQA